MKPLHTVYEPSKRHWLKMKKDYLHGGAMADTADLICLGANFGSGNKGGMMSVFLMGVYDPKRDKFLTVTRCGNGFDDNALAKLQKSLDMVRINKDMSKVPDWLVINSGVVPDFIIRDPKKAPVWEITGAEFSKADAHTADGISIRFPRVTRVRDDKCWKTATNLQELKVLYENSQQQPAKLGVSTGKLGKQLSPTNVESPPKKRKVEKDPKPQEAASSSSVEMSPKKKLKVQDSSSDDNLEWEPRKIFGKFAFYIDSKDEKESSKISRSLIAHGALDIAKKSDDTKITHWILGKGLDKPSVETPLLSKIVSIQWIYDQINKK